MEFNLKELLPAIVSILSLLAAILAWTAKLIWSKQYSQAKNETLKAKEAQLKVLEQEIKLLREFSPMKIREYFLSVKGQLEEYNDHLQDKIRRTNTEVNETIGPEDERLSKLMGMIIDLDGKTNKYLDELESYSKEIGLIHRAIKDDSYEIPTTIIKPSREEIDKYKSKSIPMWAPKSKRSVDLSEWASTNHPAYKKIKDS